MVTQEPGTINEAVLHELVGKVLVDIGATWNAGLILIGDKLGLYKALAAADAPVTSAELADRTKTHERYIREWLRAQAAGGAYVNMMMEEGTDRVRASYRDNYERLAFIKAKYDPANLFRVNQNIPPTA